MSYGANTIEQSCRAAMFVDKIFKGRTPADLPVEGPMKFEFVINLQAANKIGVKREKQLQITAQRITSVQPIPCRVAHSPFTSATNRTPSQTRRNRCRGRVPIFSAK